MPKISKSELLDALSTAYGMQPAQRRPLRPERINNPGLEKVFAAFTRDAIDPDKLETIRSKSTANLARFLKGAKSQATRSSGKTKKSQRANLAGRARDVAQFQRLTGPPLAPALVTLDKPFLIWATPHSNIIYDSNAAASNSWAKILLHRSSGGHDRLSFYFLWDNPSQYYAAINASTSLALNGHCSAYANGNITYLWHVGGNTSSIYVTASLFPWQWWNQPPTFAQHDSKDVAWVSANAGFLDDTEAQNLSGIYDLNANGLILPPGGVMVFEVALDVFYLIDDGSIDVDFNDGSFEILCPLIVISLLTSPQMAAVA